MAVFEVGIDKQFRSFSAAINAATDGDEIKIYPAFYDECFECEKNLTFTGVPDDIKDFKTYPQLYNSEEDYYTNITGECSFSNIIFTEKDTTELADYEKIISGAKLTDEIIEKYLREELEDNHLEGFCLVVKSESRFENCHFIGARNYGVVVDLNNTKKSPVFTNCGFYLNYYDGIYVTGKKTSQASTFHNCKMAYNGNGIYGGNFHLIECELTNNFSDGILFAANESKVEKCSIHHNGCGIGGEEKGSLSINETKIRTNGAEGIFLRGSSKILMNKSGVCWNQDAVIMGEKSSLVATDCTFKINNGDAFLCTGKSELTLQTCTVSENEEKGIEATEKAKVSIFESRILNNADDSVFGSKSAEIKMLESDCLENRTAVHLKGKSCGIINTCAFASNHDCEMFITENAKCEVENSHLITKQLPEKHKKNERAVAVMCADKSELHFYHCKFRSEKTKDTILALLMGEANAKFAECNFQDAENGIVVTGMAGCDVKNSKFRGCLNLDIYKRSKLASWVDVENTEISDETKKKLAVKDYEIARELLPKLNGEERKIITEYYNLDEENPEEEYRLTGEELALYFNIPVKRVERAFNKLAQLAEE